MNPFDDPNYRDFQTLRQFLADLGEATERGEMSPTEAKELFSAVTDQDNEHRIDITIPYRAALFAMGHDDIANSLTHADLIWVGVNLAVGLGGTANHRFDPDHLTRDEQLAMLHALRGVLQAGGCNAVVENDRLKLLLPVDQPDPWLDTIREFRSELDEMDDPMSKWYKPKETDS